MQAAIAQRLETLEQMIADSIGRLDRLQHLVERVLGDTPPHRPDAGARWSEAGFPLLDRNSAIHFGTGQEPGGADPDDFLASGWFAREAWGVWGSGQIQTLRLALPDWRGGYACIMLGLQCLVPPGCEKPDVDILANGYFLGSHKLGGAARTVRLRLPPSCIGDGNIVLQLRHEAATSPAAVGLSTDDRILGTGLTSLATE